MTTATVPNTTASSEGLDAIEARLEAEMLVYGGSSQEILAQAQKHWGVSRCTAQDYLRPVQQRLAGESAQEDRLLALHLSQLQHDQLAGLALPDPTPPPFSQRRNLYG
jgi:hypothetical protein